ncbi:HNH/endonuclease VII fold toxin-2 domain-containing protein [Massilia genomosp. 1]|uniref:Tox-GHH2 domain-containing protein n=1 Tax=Massilia genomosp. 1 TaxID=2609280 RepID=A0ABX0N995_9BURK|nr:HNH/endonuclease VII fold toxin-2 domain-containing protein [Massilia genomosp. 1]NHZ66729.1 hypothetical protein [Massilia genomosp. 1]
MAPRKSGSGKASNKDKPVATDKKNVNLATSNAAPAKPPKTFAGANNARARSYLAIFKTSESCKENREEIVKNCKPDAEEKEDTERLKKKKSKGGVLGAISEATEAIDKIGRVGYERSDENAWLDSHCDGMWIKPQGLADLSGFPEKYADALKKLKDQKWKLIKDAMMNLAKVAIREAGDAAKTKIIGFILRSIGKNVVGVAAFIASGGTIGAALEMAMAAWTYADAIHTAYEIAVLAGPEGAAALALVTEAIALKEGLEEALARLAKSPDEGVAEGMTLLAKTNSCLKAKRCQLVRMESTSAPKAKEFGDGCCPGQTGHHLLPREMFEQQVYDKNTKKWEPHKDNCKKYTDYFHLSAPVVCVEGTSNKAGSHGAMHKSMDSAMDIFRRKNPGKDSITYKEASETAIKTHQENFKPACNAECLQLQLDQHYKGKCDNNIKPRGGMGPCGGTTPTTPKKIPKLPKKSKRGSARTI